jgi:hypothetical protein
MTRLATTDARPSLYGAALQDIAGLTTSSLAVARLREFRRLGITVHDVDHAPYDQAIADVLGAMSLDEMLGLAQAFEQPAIARGSLDAPGLSLQ